MNSIYQITANNIVQVLGKTMSTFGVGLLMMSVPAPGLTSVLSDLARTVQPGEFVELEIDGPVSTCQAMVPPWPVMYEVDEDGNDKLDKDGNKILIPRPNQMRNILEFTDEAHWDSVNKEIYIAGTRRAYKPWDQGFVKYSEATNSWTILDVPTLFGFGAHGYDNGAIDVSRGTFYWSTVTRANNVWAMSLATGLWTQLPNSPIAAGEQSALEYFPDIDRLVFFDARGGRASMYALYNPTTNQWDAPVSLAEPFGGISHFSEYNPTHGVMFFGGGFNYSAGGTIPDPTPDIDELKTLYVMDTSGSVTRLPDAPLFLGQRGAGPIQTIDPNTGNLVVFQGEPSDGSWPCGNNPLPTWEYDLTTNAWGQAGEQTLTNAYCAMDSVAVPLYEYGVNFVVSVENENSCKVYLYKHKAENAELNIINQPAAVTVEQGQIATFNVVAVGRGLLSYQWRMNGVDIADATEASYSFTASDMANNGREFDVVVSDDAETINSVGAFLTITADTAPPTLLAARTASDTRVDLIFSEAVSASSTETIASYQIDPGITVTAATLSGDGRTVSLSVSPLSEETTYTVSVSNVQDRALPPNTIATLSDINFTYRLSDGFEDGNADGWTPLNADRWEVTTEADGNRAYALKATGFGSPGGGRLGEYSLLPSEYGDFTFTAKAKLGNTAANADYAVLFGFQDQNVDSYYYVMFNNNQNYTQLFKVVNGTRAAALATATQDWLNDNAYHNIEVSRAGNAITVKFDGNVILSANDGSLGAGRVGVGSFNDAAYFDDVSLSGAATSTPDTTPPVITLIGDNPLTITVGNAYIDPGATASDNWDGNLSANITVDGTAVDTAIVGIYNVTFNVTDAAGNAAAQLSRTVNVVAAVSAVSSPGNDNNSAVDGAAGGGGSWGVFTSFIFMLLAYRFRRHNTS